MFKPERKCRCTTESEWRDDGTRLFGSNKKNWRFICPACGHVATVQDWIDSNGAIGMYRNCIGNYRLLKVDAFSGKPGPCTYQSHHYDMNPVMVMRRDQSTFRVFEFAPLPETEPPEPSKFLQMMIRNAHTGDLEAMKVVRTICKTAVDFMGRQDLIDLAEQIVRRES